MATMPRYGRHIVFFIAGIPLATVPGVAQLPTGTQVIKHSDAEWERIEAAIKADLPVVDGVELRGEPHIEQTKAITGDGAETIIMDVGGLGASTDMLEVYRLDHGTVRAAKFKDFKGHVDPGGAFVSGSSAMHSSTVTLSAAHQTLFAATIMNADDNGKGGSCEVHAYQWNARMKMFVERASRPTDEVRCRHHPLH